MRVIVFRHGIAHDRADPACPVDAERALTEEGRKKTRKAAKGLTVVGCRPSRILTSPLLRARQTADIAAEVLEVDRSRIIVTDALLPDAPPYALFHALFAFTADDEVFCVGHAPQLDRVLALSITGGRSPVTALKKAGAAMIDVDDLPRPPGELVWLLPPRVLVELDD